MKQKSSKTITLVEASVVLIIFVILSSIVVPEVSQANADFRDEVLQAGVQQLKCQVNLYRQEHDGRLPEACKFVVQMTMRTNKAGQVMSPDGRAEDYPLGPYLERIPRNPYANKRIADRVESEPRQAGGQSAGWYFNDETGDIWPSQGIQTY